MHAAAVFSRPAARVAALAAMLLAASAGAEGARELSWQDLLPEALLDAERDAIALQQRVQVLSPADRAAFETVAIARTARMRVDEGLVAEDELTTRERAALASSPEERYPEALALWEEVEATRARLAEGDQAVEPTLDGERVRIPGYALPLEFGEGDHVTQFLLVPYVGACIHTPPPPPNQIVFVERREGFRSEGLFTPVWVEGRLSTRGGKHDLSFVDGSADIPVGYSLEADAVTPYER